MTTKLFTNEENNFVTGNKTKTLAEWEPNIYIKWTLYSF